jgi:quercetin dioxygenase-like cupin family protein
MEPRVVMSSDGETVTLPGGERIRYLEARAGAAFALLEWRSPAGALGPPLHVHRETDEGFYVFEGTFGFQAGGTSIEGSAGSFVLVPRGLEHTFWNAGQGPAAMLVTISPPGFEAYFRELAEGLAAAEGSDEQAAAVRRTLSRRHDIEVVGPRREPGA